MNPIKLPLPENSVRVRGHACVFVFVCVCEFYAYMCVCPVCVISVNKKLRRTLRSRKGLTILSRHSVETR